MLGISFVTSLKSNLCTALTTLNTTGNNCIIWHAQNTTASQDLYTHRPVLTHMHKTQLHLRIWTRIVLINSHVKNTTAPQDLNTYRLYYLTCKKHNSTSGYEHVSSLLSHMHRAQRLLRFWTPFVLNYLTCTEHNCTSRFEHVSASRLLSHYTELNRFSVIGYKINLTVKIIHIDHVLLIHKAINLALDTARA
jgi:hypothetical protein